MSFSVVLTARKAIRDRRTSLLVATAIVATAIVATAIVLSLTVKDKEQEDKFDGQVVVFPDFTGGEANLTVKPGGRFRVQIPDLSSTGYAWFFNGTKPADLATIEGKSDEDQLVHGGGVTGPPYVNATFTARTKGGSGEIAFVHVKPWQRQNPDADKGLAVLTLTVMDKKQEDEFDGQVALFPDFTGGEANLTVMPGERFRVQIPDLSSTGYTWFFNGTKPADLATIEGKSDEDQMVHGGGVTGPPYVNATFNAGTKGGKGEISFVHVKPWERQNPDADKGLAVLTLTVKRKEQEDKFDGQVALFPDFTGGEANLTVKPGERFRVQIPDLSSTGYTWFFNGTKPADLATIEGKSDEDQMVHGGGITGPPYVNATFTAGTKGGIGEILFVHVKPWERQNPDADKGLAVLTLTVKDKEQDVVVV